MPPAARSFSKIDPCIEPAVHGTPGSRTAATWSRFL
ncbi:Uncharacterised protein [Mycobacteroides abscessus]|nr:Uncharacterised protein [Mycobacteroides abscessus]